MNSVSNLKILLTVNLQVEQASILNEVSVYYSETIFLLWDTNNIYLTGLS